MNTDGNNPVPAPAPGGCNEPLSGTPAGGALANSLEIALQACADLESKLQLQAAESENIGLELIRAYEHLGIVFHLTRQLSQLKSERQVLDKFIASLRNAYPMDQVTVDLGTDILLDHGARSKSVGDDHPLPASPRARRLTERSRLEHRAVVDAGDADVGHTGNPTQLISVPVFCGNDFVCAVHIERSHVLSADTRYDPASGPSSMALNSGDMMLLDSLATFCGDLLRNFRLLEALRQASVDTVRALVSAVDQKDPYTCGHSTRVGYYATILGHELGLRGAELQMLHWSALLHDVGKIGIRDSVLNKVGRLTPDEMDHMKEHPRRGYEVVSRIPHFREALDGILHHHERMDGTGYPDGLTGNQISTQAKIIQIADVFDALTSTRSYRSAYTWQRALDIIRQDAGKVSDPDFVQVWEQRILRVSQDNPIALDAIGTSIAPPDLGAPDDPGANLNILQSSGNESST